MRYPIKAGKMGKPHKNQYRKVGHVSFENILKIAVGDGHSGICDGVDRQ